MTNTELLRKGVDLIIKSNADRDELERALRVRRFENVYVPVEPVQVVDEPVETAEVVEADETTTDETEILILDDMNKEQLIEFIQESEPDFNGKRMNKAALIEYAEKYATETIEDEDETADESDTNVSDDQNVESDAPEVVEADDQASNDESDVVDTDAKIVEDEDKTTTVES